MGEPASKKASSGTLREGTLVADRYKLVSRKGLGAMGSVWSATHLALGNTVAIKFLHAGTLTPGARARFAREAKIAAMLGESSRHIARVMDFGVFQPEGGEETPFLVMELLRGEELGERQRREHRLPLHLVASIVSQLCRALAVAHAAGVIHRDIKPANVFLALPQTNMQVFVKLMDFGVAKRIVDDDDDHTTRTGTVIGTPSYMSPEQLLARPIDHRTDLWAVAATAYRVLTGVLPFGNGTLAEVGVRIVITDPTPPSELVPGLPKALDAWMARGLAKDPANRFATAKEMADALAAIAGVTDGAPFPVPPELLTIEQSNLPTPDSVAAMQRALPPALDRTASGMRRVRVRAPMRLAFALLATAALAVSVSYAMLRVRYEHRLRPSPSLAASELRTHPKIVLTVPASTIAPALPPEPSQKPAVPSHSKKPIPKLHETWKR